MRLEVTVDVAADRRRVWEALTDWERQPEWMLDAKEVEVLTPKRDGVGVALRCPTNLLGITVEDVMRVTRWDPPHVLGVTHLGSVITGDAAFELTDLNGTRTRVTWWEEVDPPLGVVGELGATIVVRPVVRRIFARSLRRFATFAEEYVATPR